MSGRGPTLELKATLANAILAFFEAMLDLLGPSTFQDNSGGHSVKCQEHVADVGLDAAFFGLCFWGG